MSAIDLQNALQIRDPMQISCGIAARPNINLTFADLSGFVVADTNPSASLDAEEWPVIEITDLQGDGFPLDGSCSFYVAGEGSETGKLGARTHIGGTGSLTVSSTQVAFLWADIAPKLWETILQAPTTPCPLAARRGSPVLFPWMIL